MDKSFPRRRAGAAAALLAAAGLTLAACSSPTQGTASATATAITAGSGQSSLAGMPGATGTGAAQPSTAPTATGAAQPSTAPTATASMPPMTMPASAAAQTPAGAPAATDSVAIKNFAFAPAAITVKAGTTVTWTNQDTDAHTVTSQNKAGALNSQALNTGQSYSYTFTTPGTYGYLCTIHPFMTATVTVTQ
ncbi:plastocyanin/azurin family copper-binding protein [Kitasatospora sp. NPDC058190]|uniref:cupredoxin domain-containing protein n=1 Tax=Kitasatospora sp. NPDC058190 TaxID=3346371 RepID=UPI0036DA27E2